MDLNFQTCLVYHGFGTKSPNPWNLIAVPKTLVYICFSPISFFLAFVSGDYFFFKKWLDMKPWPIIDLYISWFYIGTLDKCNYINLHFSNCPSCTPPLEFYHVNT